MTFEEIYACHYDSIWRTLRRLGVSERDAADACQRVFLIALRRLHDFEGRSSVKTWLYGIALRVASEIRRSGPMRHELLIAEQPEATTEPEQVDTIEQRQRIALLDRVLEQLPSEQRTALVLYELEELTAEEIARLTRASVGTVRSRIRLARSSFSRILERLHGQPLRLTGGGTP